MTEKEHQAARFIVRLLNANLSSPTEDWEGILADWDELSDKDSEFQQRFRQSSVRDIRRWLEAKATGQSLPPEMSKQEFEDIIKFEVEVEGLKEIPRYREKDWKVKEPPELPRLREMQE